MRVALCLLGVVGAARVHVGAAAVATAWVSGLVQGEQVMEEYPVAGREPSLELRTRGESAAEVKSADIVPAGRKYEAEPSFSSDTESVAAGEGGPGFVTSNEYPPVTGSPWTHIAEPYRKTTLTAHSTSGNPSHDVFKWSFADGTVLEGREVTHTFKTLGQQPLLLTQIVISTGTLVQQEHSVMVKYVRREIRALTDEHREAFFSAMEELYRVPTSEGKILYGDDYKDIRYFVQMHLDGAGVEDCDHWHDDAGIMTHHVGYTLLFEQALQVVDPSVSIPYWEYTVEASTGLDDYDDSRIFQDDWFGAASPDNDLHTVDKGRWAHLAVMEDAWNRVHNSYGLLRTPWNSDPTPFVTRHNMTNGQDLQSIVTCSDYESCFDNDNLADMNSCLNGQTHGPVHIKVGGEWNDPEEQITQALGIMAQVPLMAKFLWRKGYLRVPASCTVESEGVGDSSTCRTSCPAELYESRGMTPYDVLMDVHALLWTAVGAQGILVWDKESQHFTVAGYEDDLAFQDKMWSKILSALCDPGHVGELFTSAAPYDPLFWVIHPAAERFLGWRRKLGREQPETHAFDETWGYTHSRLVGETGVVCDWSDVRENSLDMPKCVAGICGGHGADDILPFKVKVNGEVRKMSNLEWLDFIYPDNEDLPYMYDSFDWDHCASDGYPLGRPFRQDD